MSMYNIIFGVNPLSVVVLATLGLTRKDVGRFRDCFVTEDNEIAVYTRNGGGNREHFDIDGTEEGADCDCTGCVINYRLPKHPNYLRDVDDDFDCTYATVYFSFPKEYGEQLKLLASGKFDPDERWKGALDKLEKEGPPEKLVEALKPLLDLLKEEE